MLPELPDARMETRKLIDGPQNLLQASASDPQAVVWLADQSRCALRFSRSPAGRNKSPASWHSA